MGKREREDWGCLAYLILAPLLAGLVAAGEGAWIATVVGVGAFALAVLVAVGEGLSGRRRG